VRVGDGYADTLVAVGYPAQVGPRRVVAELSEPADA
jgi:hypothetical protein